MLEGVGGLQTGTALTQTWRRGKLPLTRAGGGSGDDDGGWDESWAVLGCSFIAGTFVCSGVGGGRLRR